MVSTPSRSGGRLKDPPPTSTTQESKVLSSPPLTSPSLHANPPKNASEKKVPPNMKNTAVDPSLIDNNINNNESEEEEEEEIIVESIGSTIMSFFTKEPPIYVVVAGLAVLATLFRTNTGWWWVQQCTLFGLRLIAWALGIALGVGWSTHVYEQLDWMYTQQQEKEQLERAGGVGAPSQLATRKLALRSDSSGVSHSHHSHHPHHSHHSHHSSGVPTALLTTASMTTSRHGGGESNSFNRNRAPTLEDEQTYSSLMQAAGYSVHPSLLRGQVLRREMTGSANVHGPQQSHAPDRYLMDRGNTAQRTLQELFGQTLHPKVQAALGKWTEYILRDFVVSWYSSVDKGVQYVAPPRGNQEASSAEGSATKENPDQKEAALTTEPESPDAKQEALDTSQIPPSLPSFSRAMVYSTARQSGIPFLDSLYESVAVVFGNLATRFEHVNVMEVVLIKWTRVLAHTFQVYRQLRRQLLLKSTKHKQQHVKRPSGSSSSSPSTPPNNTNSAAPIVSTASPPPPVQSTPASGDAAPTSVSSTSRTSSTGGKPPKASTSSSTSASKKPVSEIAMAKEFLLAGKLHRALTFGVDVPSLLFADASGRECGIVDDDIPQTPLQQQRHPHKNPTTMTPDQVLEQRLFGTALLRECEVDYNRILSHRMIRALLPRADFGSPIVSSLVTEIMASCVLTPVMGLFAPEILNGWMLQGLKSAADGKAEKKDESDKKTGEVVDGAASEKIKKNKSVRASKKGSILASSKTKKVMNEPASSSSHRPRVLDYLHRKQSREASTLAPVQELEIRSANELDLLAELEYSLTEMQRFMEFDKLRAAARATTMGTVDVVEWDDPTCRAAINRVVLVIEAALTNGRVSHRMVDRSAMVQTRTTVSSDSNPSLEVEPLQSDGSNQDSLNGENGNSIVTSTLATPSMADELDTLGEDDDNDFDDEREDSTSLHQLLMEMTGDLDAFEERVACENAAAAKEDASADVFANREHITEPYKLTQVEQSTLRTLIAAWLHTGQIYRTITLIAQAHATILSHYYKKDAFLRTLDKASDFVRQLRALDQVEVLVDTMEVLASPRLEHPALLQTRSLAGNKEEDNSPQEVSIGFELLHTREQDPTPSTDNKVEEEEEEKSVSTVLSQDQQSVNVSDLFLSSATPRHFDFHRNESFAASLRSERERRMQSWEAQFEDSTNEEDLIVSRSNANEKETKVHKELHQIARIFYNGTNLIAIRDAARRKTSSSEEGKQQNEESSSTQEEDLVSLLTVETACPRRRIEVPDDDSSFLLRAQPRPLTALGVHRDQRNHDQSFRAFAGTYEEPALKAGSEHFRGGRYVRRCQVRYFPIDRTSSIFLQNDARKVDQRKVKMSIPETITLESNNNARQTAPFISTEFLRERHICHRWIPKGSGRTHSMLASNVMEPTDFNAQPRTGRALDFVYRMSLFEKPMIELGDKKFTVLDSTAFGTHRADASSLEISDAALSAALLMVGGTHDGDNAAEEIASSTVQMGDDGYPIIWMKFSKQNDAQVEVKPYRLSFVRAALLVTESRQEAQLQSLLACVKNGSAKNATKALTDERLKPTFRLLYHAGHRSKEKQSLLLRDLKLGINHIDREQLRRNGLWNPRYPTAMKELSVCVEDALQAEEVKDVNLFGATGVFYRIKCKAIVELINDYEDKVDEDCYGVRARLFCEEWVVYRSFKEFQALHKHLKSIVSQSESSGNAVTRLSASLQASTQTAVARRKRGVLIPSLSQASKIGTLGLTKKALEKRKEHLDGYLGYIFAPNHLLNRCPELLLFVGAFYPFPLAVELGIFTAGLPDPLGRTRMMRSVIEEESEDESDENEEDAPENQDAAVNDEDMHKTGDETQPKIKKPPVTMLPAIRHKIDRVPLSQVRNRIFELLRYQFGFENASFMRNRMLAGLKTASFAVTSSSEFRRTLYNLHLKHLSAPAVAHWIDFVHNIVWPNGAFFQAAPPLTPVQMVEQREKSKSALHECFPDALRTILGQELTRDGLNIVHEMLQNRVVVKSMFYMLFDILWLEVFPEIGDVLQGGAALDAENHQ